MDWNKFSEALLINLPSILVATGGLIAVWRKINNLHSEINHKMDELNLKTAEAADAKGEKRGREEAANIGNIGDSETAKEIRMIAKEAADAIRELAEKTAAALINTAAAAAAAKAEPHKK